MARFRVVRRNNRTKEDHLYEDISLIVNDMNAIFYDSYCLPGDVDSIYAAMNMVDNYFNKVGVRSIGFEITVESVEQMQAYDYLQQMLQWIGQSFYTLGVILEVDEGYMIRLLVHTTSYRTGEKFHDNNSVLVDMVQYLHQMTGQDFKVCNGTFFTGTSADDSCFV